MNQRNVPGIDAAYLAMDTEEGVEVVWNEVKISERKNFKMLEVRHIVTKFIVTLWHFLNSMSDVIGRYFTGTLYEQVEKQHFLLFYYNCYAFCPFFLNLGKGRGCI